MDNSCKVSVYSKFCIQKNHTEQAVDYETAISTLNRPLDEWTQDQPQSAQKNIPYRTPQLPRK